MKILVDVDGTLYKSIDAKKLIDKMAAEGKEPPFPKIDVMKNRKKLRGAMAKVPLRQNLIAWIEKQHKEHEFYCWSAGGAIYAEAFCCTHKIDHLFRGFFYKGSPDWLPAADLYIDDAEEFLPLTLFVENQEYVDD